MKYMYTRSQLLLLLCCLLGGLSALRAEIPFVNDLVSHEAPTNVQLFNSDEDIPFLGAMQQAVINQQYAGQVMMMDCFDVFTVGNDNAVVGFGDTVVLIGTATNVDGGSNTNFSGIWFVSDEMGGISDDGTFILPNGNPAPEVAPGSNLFFGSFSGMSDTILFIRDPADPADNDITDFPIVFQATNLLNGNCTQRDTNLVRIDLMPNLNLTVDNQGTPVVLEAGAFPVGSSLSTAYCSGQELELDAAVTRNPTLSGQPVFVLTEVTDTSNQLGLGALDGDTLYLTPNQLDFSTTLANTGDEDIFVQLRLFPYYESDGTSTVPGTSTFTPGDDVIGDSIELDFIVYSEPIASFGGNDTICYGADVPLDFTGTPNTRVFYRDTLTMTTDSVDLNALGFSTVTFTNVTTDLFFVIDSLVRLDPPFCTASPITLAGIAPQPFVVLDSIAAVASSVDSVACDTLGFASFDFFANDSASVYSFLLTNNMDDFDSTYIAQGEDTLAINLNQLNFQGNSAAAITFYISSLVDTTSTANCDNPVLQDSFVIYVDPTPELEYTFDGNVLLSESDTTFRDTFCVSDIVAISAQELTTSQSGRPMYVRQIDSLYNIETGTVITFDTIFVSVTPDLTTNGGLALSMADSQILVRTILPYFESMPTATTLSYDDDTECAGTPIRLEVLLTPAPLEPTVMFSADSICGDDMVDLELTNGTPGATVGYVITSNGTNSGVETTVLDVNGEATINYTPLIDSGQVIVNLQFVSATCNDLITGADTVFVKPLPTGSITLSQDSVCLTDSVYVIFNTTTTFETPLNVVMYVRDMTGADVVPIINDEFVNGDTLYRGEVNEDLAFRLRRVRYQSSSSPRCDVLDLQFDTVRVENNPALGIDITEVSVSPDMSGMTTSPDSVYIEVCADDSLYLNYYLPTVNDTSRFNDSVWVALFINDPLGVTPLGVGQNMTMFDIDEPGAFDSLFLENNTNDTARIEILAVPYFTGVDMMGNPTTTFADACKGDSIEIVIDVINNFVSTIGGNYIVCTGIDTVVVITGPDFAEIDYVAITADGAGDFDTSLVRTVMLDGLGRFEIEIDSILQDTTYDLVAARLPGSMCEANLGPNITVSVIPVPVATFDSTTLMVCEGAAFSTTLFGPPEGFARVSNNVDNSSIFVAFDEDSIATFTFDSLVGNTTFYIDSIYNDTTGLNPVCLTDTITDSLIVIQLDAAMLTLTTDTICAGDTAYVTLVASTLDTFNVVIDSAGVSLMIDSLVNGDTLLALNGITDDSTLVILESAIAITGPNQCAVLPTGGNLDTAIVRVDTLPQLTVNFTEPVMETLTATSAFDTLIICSDELITTTATSTPMANIAGVNAMVFGGANVRIGGGGPTFPLPGFGSGTSAPLSALDTMMANVPTFGDSTIVTYEVVLYYPQTPGAAYNPATDCTGDTVNFTIIALPPAQAFFIFGQDTICEDMTTDIFVVAGVGDTVLFAVEGFGTTNIVIPPTGFFEYNMPAVEDFDNAPGGGDDNLVFAILSVNSATMPSCTNNTPFFDTITVERLPIVDFSIPDTTICVGDDAVVNFTSGTPDATVYLSLDYENQADVSTTIMLDGAGEADLTLPGFMDTVTITVDSIVSNSSFACTTIIDSTLSRIISVPLPMAALLVDTVCIDSLLEITFNYTGDRMLTATDSFDIVVNAPGIGIIGAVTTKQDSVIFSDASLSPGAYSFFLQSVTDNTTGCVTNYPGMGLEFVAVVEAAPAFQIEFTGGVENGQTYDTDNPPVFPIANTILSSVCSGTNLMTDIIGANAGVTGDTTNIRLEIFRDDLLLFNGLSNTVDSTLSILDFNRTLVNLTDTVQQIWFDATPYFESDNTAGLDADECQGQTLTFIFNVYPLPRAEFTEDTVRVCSGEEFFIKFDGSEGANVDFEDDEFSGPFTNFYNSTVGPNDSVSYVASQVGPDTIRFFITNVDQTFTNGGINQNCVGTSMDTLVLIVNPLPLPYLEFAANDTICFNETVDVIFRDSVGTGPWTVTVDGVTYTPTADGDTIFTTGPLAADSTFTIEAATDANGCAANEITPGVVSQATVTIELVATLTTDIDIFNFFGGNEDSDMLVDGLLEVDTFCSLQRIEFDGSTTTPTSVAGDPIYVRVELTGDVNAIYGAMYAGDTTLFVPLADIDDALNTALIANSSDSTLDAQIILTPYFETDISMPGIGADECTGAMDTIRFFVDPRPEPANNMLEFRICSGDTFNLELASAAIITNYVPGTEFTYVVTSTGAATAPDRPMASDEDINDELVNISLDLDTVTYTITPFSASGCQGDDFVIDVIVDPEPVLVTNTQTVCSRELSELRTTHDPAAVRPNRFIVANVDYSLSDLTATNVLTIGDTINRNMTGTTTGDDVFIRDQFTNVSTDTQQVTYSLIPLVIQTGCTGDTVDFTLNVLPEPLVADRDTVVCTDVRLNIDLQGFVENDVASTFNWVAVSGDFALIDGETTTTQVNSQFITDSLRLTTAAGTQQRQITYLVTVAGDNGCPVIGTNSFLYTVFVSPNIQLTTSTPDGDFICSGDPDGLSIVATASNTIGTVNYDWSISNADPTVMSPVIIDPTGNGSTINVNASGNGQFTVNLVVTDDGGCEAMTSTTITVFDELVAGFDTTYVGGSLSATVDFTDETEGFPTQWLWTFGDPASGSADTSMVQNPTHTYGAPGTYNVTLQVIRQAFCPDTATITQEVVIGFVPVAKCDTVVLYPGFNVISLDVDSTDNSVAAIFDEILNFEVTPGNSNLNQVIGIHPDQSSSPLIFTDFFQTLSNIRPGFGYAVNVDVQDTLIVCGTTIDTSTRVDLQAGMNIVAYLPQDPGMVTTYFDSIISDNNLSLIQSYDMGNFEFWTPFTSSFSNLQNSLGYVLDVSAAYTGAEWRDGNYSSSNFEYVYGSTSMGNTVANYPVEVIDEEGEVLTTFNLDQDGNFGPEFLFGIVEDVNTHEVYGIANGTEVRFRINGQVSNTSHIFNGGWVGTELNIEFSDVVLDVNENIYETVRINIFPNPAQQVANLRVVSAERIASLQVEVLNATGRTVSSQVIEEVRGEQNVSLNVRELPAGLYLVRITADGNYLGSEQLIIRR